MFVSCPRESVRLGRLWVAIAVALGCLVGVAALGSERAAAAKPPSAEREWIRQTLARMTLEEKVGQLFVVNGFGRSLRDRDPEMVRLNRRFYGVDNIAELIEKFDPGGIIYFDWSNGLEKPAQIVGLSNGIQRLTTRQHSRVPMLISTDQEQGEVLRIGPPATVFPGNMALGAARDVKLARRAARITGEELRAMGINVDNAPVVDVNVNPLNESDGVRAFGDRVDFVSKYGGAAVRGYQTAMSSRGVAATAKHFPGFGAASENTDFAAERIDLSKARLRAVDEAPFRAFAEAGGDLVMLSTAIYPAYVDQPAAFSRAIASRELRGRLGFEGVSVTDALGTPAVRAYGGPARAGVGAARAGVDLLLFNTLGEAERARRALLARLRTKRLDRDEFEASVERVLALRARLGTGRAGR